MARAGIIRVERATMAVAAALALLLQVAIPQGYMPARTANGPSIVICTGNGPLMRTSDQGAPTKAPKPGGACAFAGHGSAPLAGTTPALRSTAFEYALAPVVRLAAIAPGRGLAAPPPPSHGPPTTLL